MLFKVLVLAMLSSASGWGLPNDPLLESNEASTSITVEVDGARGWRQLVADVGAASRGFFCDRGCNEGCDGWLGGSCDYGCDRSCDGCQMAAGCQEQREDNEVVGDDAEDPDDPQKTAVAGDFSSATAVVTGAVTKGEAGGEAKSGSTGCNSGCDFQAEERRG